MPDTLTLPCDPRSAAEARGFVEQRLSSTWAASLSETTLLLTSEIVTNAILHAGTMVEVAIRVLTDRVRVEVWDSGGGSPSRRAAAPEDASGRGLSLVEALSSAWGVRGAGRRKCVWFEVTQ